MFSWAVVFLIVALVAGVLGFTGIAGTAIMFARIVFGVALVLFVLAVVLGKRIPRI